MGAAIVRTTTFVAASVLAFMLVPFVGAWAAEKSLSWDDELCHYSIRFDPGKYDEVKVRNTLHLLFGPQDFNAPLASFPPGPQIIPKGFDLRRTTEACSQALETANRLAFLPLKGIDDYRSARVTEIRDSCQFEAVKIRGYREPSALREYSPGAAACSRFIDALDGKSEVLAVFRETLDQNCSQNASPELCIGRQIENSQKPDGIEWVRLYLLGFGWNNCANKFAVRTTDGKKLARMRAQLETEFRRQFKVAKEKCDEPQD